MIRTNGKRAFTLVELLVVVAMIAILTAVVSTSISAAQRRARIQKATAEVKIATQAILGYENHNRNHELPTMIRKELSQANVGFLFGNGEKSASDFQIPVLLQAALSSGGVMRDPWGMPYLVTIRSGAVSTPQLDSVRTGYFLPNINCLTEEERK